jgi:hypothetical protein
LGTSVGVDGSAGVLWVVVRVRVSTADAGHIASDERNKSEGQKSYIQEGVVDKGRAIKKGWQGKVEEEESQALRVKADSDSRRKLTLYARKSRAEHRPVRQDLHDETKILAGKPNILGHSPQKEIHFRIVNRRRTSRQNHQPRKNPSRRQNRSIE